MFLPDDKSMYPTDGSGLKYSVFVNEKELSQGMEGASRPGHFEGVTTVVTKLFLLTQPHFAIFGAKDFQQARVIQKMTTDLNFPVQNLQPVTRVDFQCRVAIAARLGRVRLIDNASLAGSEI